uniref:Uncharacterized protein n=2 Tax=Parascaris univalens TaxID=6257 RepID=A0A915ABL6_PARUN
SMTLHNVRNPLRTLSSQNRQKRRGEKLSSQIARRQVKMSFEKIGEPAKAIFDNMETYHHSALLNDHLWIFSRKYKEQPLHNWGHRVSFCGGYSAYFDIGSKSWSSKVEYPSLSVEENLEEVLFMLNSNIFLLLYTQFGGINFERLLRWDIDERNWTTVGDFKVLLSCFLFLHLK